MHSITQTQRQLDRRNGSLTQVLCIQDQQIAAAFQMPVADADEVALAFRGILAARHELALLQAGDIIHQEGGALAPVVIEAGPGVQHQAGIAVSKGLQLPPNSTKVPP